MKRLTRRDSLSTAWDYLMTLVGMVYHPGLSRYLFLESGGDDVALCLPTNQHMLPKVYLLFLFVNIKHSDEERWDSISDMNPH